MIRISMEKSLMMNLLISVLNNISDKWPFKDSTERKVTIQDGTRDKWTNKNSPIPSVMLLDQSIFKHPTVSLTFCSAKSIWTRVDGLHIKFISSSWSIISEVKIWLTPIPSKLMNGINGFLPLKDLGLWIISLDWYSINWERSSYFTMIIKT